MFGFFPALIHLFDTSMGCIYASGHTCTLESGLGFLSFCIKEYSNCLLRLQELTALEPVENIHSK